MIYDAILLAMRPLVEHVTGVANFRQSCVSFLHLWTTPSNDYGYLLPDDPFSDHLIMIYRTRHQDNDQLAASLDNFVRFGLLAPGEARAMLGCPTEPTPEHNMLLLDEGFEVSECEPRCTKIVPVVEEM